MALGIFAITIFPSVYATHIGGCPHSDLNCIATAFEEDPPFESGTVVLTVEEAYQGRNTAQPRNLESTSSLQWKLRFTDGTEFGSTSPISAIFTPFTAFDPSQLFSFIQEGQALRNLIDAEVITFTDYSRIGSDLCFTLPRTNIDYKIFVNGKQVDIARNIRGADMFNQSTYIASGAGALFNSELVERLLALKGVTLQSGDRVDWKVTINNRYDVWEGAIISLQPLDQFSPIGSGTCGITGATAFDAYVSGMSLEFNFIWVSAVEQILIPTTTEPDLDGDGIPDSVDQCDFTTETFNGFMDTDGCPDVSPTQQLSPELLDSDGDTILDIDDMCPFQRETFNTYRDGDGCPDDGVFLDVNYSAFEVTGEEIQVFTTTGEQIFVEEIVVSPTTAPMDEPITTESLVDPLSFDEILIDLETSETNFYSQVSSPTAISSGISGSCNKNINPDCDDIVFQALQRSGIELPFQLNTLNLIIIVAIAVGAILIILRLRKRI